MDKATLGKILGILLTAAVALLAVFGYDVAVIQPRALQFVPAAAELGATLDMICSCVAAP